MIVPLHMDIVRVPSQSADPNATDSAPSIRESNVQSFIMISPKFLSAPIPSISFALNSVEMCTSDIWMLPPQELNDAIPPTLSPDILKSAQPFLMLTLHGSLKLPMPSPVFEWCSMNTRESSISTTAPESRLPMPRVFLPICSMTSSLQRILIYELPSLVLPPIATLFSPSRWI